MPRKPRTDRTFKYRPEALAAREAEIPRPPAGQVTPTLNTPCPAPIDGLGFPIGQRPKAYA